MGARFGITLLALGTLLAQAGSWVSYQTASASTAARAAVNPAAVRARTDARLAESDRARLERFLAEATATVARHRRFAGDADALFARLGKLEDRLRREDERARDDAAMASIEDLQTAAQRVYAAIAFAVDDCNVHDARIELTRARIALDRAAMPDVDAAAAAAADIAAEEGLERESRCAIP